MNSHFVTNVTLVLAVFAAGRFAAGESPAALGPADALEAVWPMERIELKDRRSYEGLIDSEDKDLVHMIVVGRPQGKPMYVVVWPIPQRLIVREKTVRLDAAGRAELRRRIGPLIGRTKIERSREEAVTLGQVQRENRYFHQYRGRWFTLESNADEEITRQIIVRVDQVFTAYRQILPPRAEPQRPLRLLVLRSMAEHRAYLERRGVQVTPPACYFPDDNLIVAGSELAHLAARLAEVGKEHAKHRAELRRLQQRLTEQLAAIAQQLRDSGASPGAIQNASRQLRRRFDEEMKTRRTEIKICDRKNAQAFSEITKAMLGRLYHEAFHAYVENRVFPRAQFDVPAWLDEGLATMLEEGVLESDTLRVDAPNRAALARLKEQLASGSGLQLGQVLAVDERSFAAAGGQPYYDYAWGLAYYLTFEQRLLGGPELDRFVARASPSSPPAARFERVTGKPLADFERCWREYILELR